MSEVRLNIKDRERTISGTCHGSVADAALAALSAEPETIAEFEAAVARFIRPVDHKSPFPTFQAGENLEPWDAGIVILDLAARVIATDSIYSELDRTGDIFYHDGEQTTDIAVLYRVPDDWLFVSSLDEYLAAREGRRKERAANPPFDARAVLYGRALTEFIVNECLTVRNGASSSGEARTAGDDIDIEDSDPGIAAIHAKWLMTPREDLLGASPREMLLAKRSFIELDIQDREVQWSFVGEGPPCLSRNSFAFRFAGFGTNENVVYYYLVRHLIESGLERINVGQVVGRGDEATRLEQQKSDWLEQPQRDLDDRIPALIIENERRRFPLMMTSRAIVLDDCPTCQLMGEGLHMGPGFWHFDGSSMDDDFPFSFHRTREEWEAEKRQWEEFNAEFDRKWAERESASDSDPSALSDQASDLIQ